MLESREVGMSEDFDPFDDLVRRVETLEKLVIRMMGQRSEVKQEAENNYKLPSSADWRIDFTGYSGVLSFQPLVYNK